MAAANTHLILARMASEDTGISHVNLRFLLLEQLKYLQQGSIGPDLPYSQVLNPTNSHQKIADKLHQDRTNELPIRAFNHIKGMPESVLKDQVFCWVLGYCSHIVADGIIHPFIRDKVGDYEQNKTTHREREMGIDVLLLDFVTRRSGLAQNLNYTAFHDQLLDPLSEEFRHISGLVAKLINEIYRENISHEDIEGWIRDIHGMLELAEGEHSGLYYRFPGMEGIQFPDREQVLDRAEEYLILRKNEPKDRVVNFLGRDVHFFDDCVPMFFEVFGPLATKAYRHVYEGGPPLETADFPEISLDTGRPLAVANGQNLDESPSYWGLA